MTFYIDHRIPDIGEKARSVIVDGAGKIINNNPSKDELKGLKGFPKENYNRLFKNRVDYTEEELLNCLRQFYEKYGSPPTMEDFRNNSDYPNPITYRRRFGNWSYALKRVGLDVESMVKRGIIETSDQKARFSEMIIRDHFEKNSVDLSGENKNSPCDGICPNGKIYDVKSSGLSFKDRYWHFDTGNRYKDNIEIYYLLALNRDYTELIYAWRVSGEIVEKDDIYIGINSWSHAKVNIENMKEFDITEKMREVLGKYGFFNKVKKAEMKIKYDTQLYDGYITVE